MLINLNCVIFCVSSPVWFLFPIWFEDVIKDLWTQWLSNRQVGFDVCFLLSQYHFLLLNDHHNII